ncbi:MAG: lipopolysaccharide biosynthesis protein [Hyphomicrobiaceae bacterium]
MTTPSENVAQAHRLGRIGPGLAGLREAVLRLVRPSGERQRTQSDAITAFTIRVLSAGLLYLSQIVLARWMGSFEYGIYVFVWTLVLVLGGLSNLGISTVMIRLLPEYRETGQADLARGLLRYGRLMVLASSTVMALLGLGGLKLFGAHVSSYYILPAYLALICVPMITLSDVQDGIGRGRGWMKTALFPPYVLRPLLVLATMSVAHSLGWPMCAVTATGAAIVATWIAAVTQTLLLRQRLSRDLPDGPAARPADLWLKTSLPLFAITGSELLLQNTDVLIVSHFLTPEHAAIYFAAAKTMSLVMFIHYAVGSAVANRFSALNARGDKAELAAFVSDAVRWTFWPSLVAALGILAMGLPLLSLFGPNFTSGYPVMFVLVLGFLGRAAMGPSEFILNMLGQQKVCAIIIASMAALNIVLGVVLVPRFGIMGAAVATATALILGALLNTLFAYRRLGLRIGIWSNLWRPPASS